MACLIETDYQIKSGLYGLILHCLGLQLEICKKIVEKHDCVIIFIINVKKKRSANIIILPDLLTLAMHWSHISMEETMHLKTTQTP